MLLVNKNHFKVIPFSLTIKAAINILQTLTVKRKKKIYLNLRHGEVIKNNNK